MRLVEPEYLSRAGMRGDALADLPGSEPIVRSPLEFEAVFLAIPLDRRSIVRLEGYLPREVDTQPIVAIVHHSLLVEDFEEFGTYASGD